MIAWEPAPDVRRRRTMSVMEGGEAFHRVVDRLHDWFAEHPRERVVEILREETLRYQEALLADVEHPPAEHVAFERLQELRVTERPAMGG